MKTKATVLQFMGRKCKKFWKISVYELRSETEKRRGYERKASN